MTRRVPQRSLVLGLSHPVGVTRRGSVSAEAGVSRNLSLPIKVTTDATCLESLTATLCLYSFVSSRLLFFLFLLFSFDLLSILCLPYFYAISPLLFLLVQSVSISLF